MYRGWTQTDCQKWLQHVQRMDTDRLPKVATTCTEDGHRQTAKSGYNIYRGWTQTDCQKWLQLVQRMDTDRLLKVATTCTEDGHRGTAKRSCNIYGGWTQTDCQNRHYNINQKVEIT